MENGTVTFELALALSSSCLFKEQVSNLFFLFQTVWQSWLSI